MDDQIKTLQQAIQHFTDPENCRKFMEFVRWPDGKIACPYCGATKLTWLAKANVYRCYGDHKKQKFSLKVGTVFEDSPIGLDKWLPAVWLLSNCKNGISSYELHRSIGVTQKTAWFMLHRIRTAMESNSFVKMGGNEGGGWSEIEVDETFVGGRESNMHLERRIELRDSAGSKGRQSKAIVMGILDREARQVRAKVIPDVRREVLQNEILRQVAPHSFIYTDAHKGYVGLDSKQFIHMTVSHVTDYVKGSVHTQGIENFWSLLKRGLNGTYVAVEPSERICFASRRA
jgi:transposase-like protein